MQPAREMTHICILYYIRLGYARQLCCMQTPGQFWATCCTQQMWLCATDISYDTLCNVLPALFSFVVATKLLSVSPPSHTMLVYIFTLAVKLQSQFTMYCHRSRSQWVMQALFVINFINFMNFAIIMI